MEIIIPLLVIVAMFVIGLVNKSNQSARNTSAPSPYPESEEEDYTPQHEEYSSPYEYAPSLETIDNTPPFSYDDNIETVSTISAQPLEEENIYTKYMNNRVASGSVPPAVVDRNDITNSEIKDADANAQEESIDFDGRKAIIYSEILRPKYL